MDENGLRKSSARRGRRIKVAHWVRPLQVVEVVNAAETLQRTGSQPNINSSFAAKVSDELDATALNSREKRKVLHALTITEVPLEKRLLNLANGLGSGFCLWFFDGQVNDWALVASEVRNALSHGYPRAVNNLAVAALIATYAADKAIVDLAAAQSAITENSE